MANNIHSIANVYELVEQMKDLTDNQILDKFYKELLWGKKDYQILASCQIALYERGIFITDNDDGWIKK